MGANNPRNPRNIPKKRRPQELRGRPNVPPAVIVIYIVMAILILAICAIVFVVTLKNTGDTNASNSSGIAEPASTTSSSEQSSAAFTQSSVSQSSTESSDELISLTSSDWSENSDTAPSEPTSSSNTEDENSAIYIYSKDVFNNDLFIGDSIFTGLSGYGFLDAENVAAKIGYTPSAAMSKAFDEKGISAVEYAKQRQPERIYLMLGSNTMASGTNFDVIVSQYRELVEKLQEDCPNSGICVISIPPVTEDSSSAKTGNITNENIRMVNAKLETMAEDCKADYFDLNAILSDENGFFKEEYAEQDGLHFRGNTYKVLLSELQTRYIVTTTVN